MAFRIIAPVLPRTLPGFKASARVLKDGTVIIWLSLSELSVKRYFGESQTKAMIEVDPDEFQVKVTVDKNGPFEMTLFGKGGGRFILPDFTEGGIVEGRESEVCKLVSGDDKQFVVQLPRRWIDKAEVKTTQNARTDMADARNTQTKVPPPTNGGADGAAKLDVITYLRKKGLKAFRLAAGRFTVDGKDCLAADVLRLINDHRRAEGLKNLMSDEVH